MRWEELPLRDVAWDDLRARARPVLTVGAFLGGFAWDALTLVRVDRFEDNLFIGAYAAALAVLLVLEHRVSTAPEAWPRLAPHGARLVYGSQFFFGGLFSASLVFYARSASWGPQLAFVGLLAALFVANEFLHGLLRRTWLRLALFWLGTFSWFLFLIPVLTHWAGFLLPLLAAALSTGLVLLLALAMFAGAPLDQLRSLMKRHLAMSGALLALVLGLDLLGVVPPLPIAAMEIGIFHGVEPRKEPGEGRRPTRYWLKYEQPPWYLPLRDDDRVFRWRKGEKAACFTAIFAPTGMKVHVQHVWERWDPLKGWVETFRRDAFGKGAIVGGADTGLRTWTEKSNLSEGAWRCRAVTDTGREIARATFTVIPTTEPGVYVERPWD